MQPNKSTQPSGFPDVEHFDVFANLINYLRNYLLERLQREKFGKKFMCPVGPKITRNIIQAPVDVNMIRKRAENLLYKTVDHMLKDIFHIISNCNMFYKPWHDVYRQCLKLEAFLKRVLEKMPQVKEVPFGMDEKMFYKRNILQHFYTLSRLDVSVKQLGNAHVKMYLDNKITRSVLKMKEMQISSIKDINTEMENIINTANDKMEAATNNVKVE